MIGFPRLFCSQLLHGNWSHFQEFTECWSMRVAQNRNLRQNIQSSSWMSQPSAPDSQQVLSTGRVLNRRSELRLRSAHALPVTGGDGFGKPSGESWWIILSQLVWVQLSLVMSAGPSLVWRHVANFRTRGLANWKTSPQKVSLPYV